METEPPDFTPAETDTSNIEKVVFGDIKAVRKRAQIRSDKTVLCWKKEVEVLGRVSNRKNITQVLDANIDDLSIVLRYEPGTALGHCLKPGTTWCSLGPVDGDALWVQMAGALTYIHSKGIIQDDVKPENIVWNAATHEAVLVDFGAAIVCAGPTPIPFDPSGTPPYVPPEFLLRHKGAKGESDVWALGVTMLFVFGCVELPSGNWILPHVFEDRAVRKELEDWLEEVERCRPKREQTSPLHARMLTPDPEKRVSSSILAQCLADA